MSRFKGTSGPWVAECLDTFGYKPRVFGQLNKSGGKLIAEIGNAEDPQYSQDEWATNARAIAAVPEMIAALDELTGWQDAVEIAAPELGGLLSAMYRARAALDAATKEETE